jgi:hypothetical protein
MKHIHLKKTNRNPPNNFSSHLKENIHVALLMYIFFNLTMAKETDVKALMVQYVSRGSKNQFWHDFQPSPIELKFFWE